MHFRKFFNTIYNTEFCFSLGLWFVIVQLEVRLYTGFIKQYFEQHEDFLCEFKTTFWSEVFCGFIYKHS